MFKCRYVYVGWLCSPHKLGTVGLGFYHRSVQGTYVFDSLCIPRLVTWVWGYGSHVQLERMLGQLLF